MWDTRDRMGRLNDPRSVSGTHRSTARWKIPKAELAPMNVNRPIQVARMPVMTRPNTMAMNQRGRISSFSISWTVRSIIPGEGVE